MVEKGEALNHIRHSAIAERLFAVSTTSASL